MVDRHSQTTDDLIATRFFCHAFRFDRGDEGETTKDAKDTKDEESTTASLEKSDSLVATILNDSGG
jgi:hypothetical protein